MLVRRTKSFAVDMILNHDATYNEAYMATGIRPSTVARAVKSFKQTGEVYHASGPHPRLPNASIERLAKIVTKHALLQAAFDTPQFAALVREEEKLLAKKYGKRVDKVKIDIPFARRVVKKYWKAKVKGTSGASIQSQNATEQSKKSKRQQKSLNEMMASRQRAMLLTGHEALKRRSEIVLDKLNALQEKLAKKKAAEIAKKQAEDEKQQKIKEKQTKLQKQQADKEKANAAKQDKLKQQEKRKKRKAESKQPAIHAAKKATIGIVPVKCLICSRTYDEFSKFQQAKWNQCNGCKVHFCQDHLDSMSGHVKFCKKAKWCSDRLWVNRCSGE